jgi:hypothetical protein
MRLLKCKLLLHGTAGKPLINSDRVIRKGPYKEREDVLPYVKITIVEVNKQLNRFDHFLIGRTTTGVLSSPSKSVIPTGIGGNHFSIRFRRCGSLRGPVQ